MRHSSRMPHAGKGQSQDLIASLAGHNEGGDWAAFITSSLNFPAQFGHMPCVNVASVCVHTYCSTLCQKPWSERTFLHQPQMGMRPERDLTSARAFCNSSMSSRC